METAKQQKLNIQCDLKSLSFAINDGQGFEKNIIPAITMTIRKNFFEFCKFNNLDFQMIIPYFIQSVIEETLVRLKCFVYPPQIENEDFFYNIINKINSKGQNFEEVDFEILNILRNKLISLTIVSLWKKDKDSNPNYFVEMTINDIVLSLQEAIEFVYDLLGQSIRSVEHVDMGAYAKVYKIIEECIRHIFSNEFFISNELLLFLEIAKRRNLSGDEIDENLIRDIFNSKITYKFNSLGNFEERKNPNNYYGVILNWNKQKLLWSIKVLFSIKGIINNNWGMFINHDWDLELRITGVLLEFLLLPENDNLQSNS